MKRVIRIVKYASISLLVLLLIVVGVYYFSRTLPDNAARKMEYASVAVLTEAGYAYRDLNKNGRLDTYEDARAPIDERVEDLLKQMTLEENAGSGARAAAALRRPPRPCGARPSAALAGQLGRLCRAAAQPFVGHGDLGRHRVPEVAHPVGAVALIERHRQLAPVGRLRHPDGASGLDGGARRTYVSVDGGMSDNIRTALYDADYSCTIASRRSEAPPVLGRVVGKHCEAGDIVVKDEFVPGDLGPGDLLAVPGTGAYCRSMASNYNHALRPPVVAVADGRATVVVRRETVDDLLSTDVG